MILPTTPTPTVGFLNALQTLLAGQGVAVDQRLFANAESFPLVPLAFALLDDALTGPPEVSDIMVYAIARAFAAVDDA